MVRSGTRVAVRTVVKIPNIEGLALALKITRQTVYGWANKGLHPKFSYTVEQLHLIQADRLINGGLSHEYKDSIVKLILPSKLGYVPKEEHREVDDWDELLKRAEELDDADPDAEAGAATN